MSFESAIRIQLPYSLTYLFAKRFQQLSLRRDQGIKGRSGIGVLHEVSHAENAPTGCRQPPIRIQGDGTSQISVKFRNNKVDS